MAELSFLVPFFGNLDVWKFIENKRTKLCGIGELLIKFALKLDFSKDAALTATTLFGCFMFGGNTW